MHVDQYTLCYLKFEDDKKPWKDECGNIFYEIPDTTDPENLIYPQTSNLQHVNGRRSFKINSKAAIKCDSLNFDLNENPGGEWTIDFWLFIPQSTFDHYFDMSSFTISNTNFYVINLYNRALISSFTANMLIMGGRYSSLQSPAPMEAMSLTNQWIHLAIVKTTTEIYTYFNGRQLELVFKLDTVDLPYRGIIGSSTNDKSIVIQGSLEENYPIYMDDFRISNKARYTTVTYHPEYELDHEFHIWRTPKMKPKYDTRRELPDDFTKAVKRNVTRTFKYEDKFSKYSSTIELKNKTTGNKGLYYHTHRKVSLSLSADNKGSRFDTEYKFLLDLLDPNNMPVQKLTRIISRTYKAILSPIERNIVFATKGNTIFKIIRKVTITTTKGKNKIPDSPTKRNIILALSDKNGKNNLPEFKTKRKITLTMLESNKTNKPPKFVTHRILLKKMKFYFDTDAQLAPNVDIEITNKLIREIVYKFTERKPYSRPVYRDIYFFGPIHYKLIRVVQGDSELYNRDYNMGRNVVAFVFNTNYELQKEYVNVPYSPDYI